MDNNFLILSVLCFIICIGFSFVLGYYTSQKRKYNNKIKQMISKYLGAGAIPFYYHSLPQIEKEIYRARRYNRVLSIIIISRNIKNSQEKGNQNGSNENENKKPNQSNLELFQLFPYGPIIKESLRFIDITAYDAKNNRFIIILPETTKNQAQQTVHKFVEVLNDNLVSQLRFNIAEFPNDGLMLEELVNKSYPVNHLVSHQSNEYPD